MKTIRFLRAFFPLLFGFLPWSSQAEHLDPEAIAIEIAISSGGDPADYLTYAISLAKTLESLPPAKVKNAMGDPNYEKLVTGLDDHSDDLSDEIANSPEYQAALTTYNAAYEARALAEHAHEDAEEAVEEVLEDEAGLKTDEIVGNYIAALYSALYQLRLAETALEEAQAAEAEALAALNEFDPDSSDDHDDHEH